MTFYVDRECDIKLLEDMEDEEFLSRIAACVAEYEKCPYDISVNMLITNGEGIRTFNREYRDIDSETDVLSFPCVDYESPSDFSLVKQDPVSYIDQESGELMLGDIMINAERVIAQAGQYGHSIKREYAFLITHSMLHLFGYDHENKEDETVMFEKQDRILDILGIFR